jgi:DNA repair exonuclease SbcCD ATPase subunit
MSRRDSEPSALSTEDGLIAELDRIEIPRELLNPAELRELSSQVKHRLDAAKSAADRLNRSLKKEGFERLWETFNGDQTKVLQHALTEIHHLAQLEAKMVLVGLLLAKKHNQSAQRLHAQQELLADQQNDLKSLHQAEAEINRQIHAVVSDLAGVRSRMEAHREQMEAHSVQIQEHSERISAFCQQMNEYVAASLESSERQAVEFQTGIAAEFASHLKEWKAVSDQVSADLASERRHSRTTLILAGVAIVIAVAALLIVILK